MKIAPVGTLQKPIDSTGCPNLSVAMDIALHDRGLGALLLIFLGLALVWNFITPVFETPDEPEHVQYILFVLEKGHRPDLQTEVKQAGVQAPQAPLYYFVLGAALWMSGQSHTFPNLQVNPDFFLSDRSYSGAPNLFLPVDGSYDQVHFLRGFSAVFGLITVTCTYLAGALIGANRACRVAATATTAFLPQFTFISGAVQNDTLTAALASIAFVWLLHLLRSKSARASEALIYGAICGVAFLSKYHAIFFLPFGLIVQVLASRGNWRLAVQQVGWSMSGFLIVAGWLLFDNWWRYGDLTVLGMQMTIVPSLVHRKTLLDPYFVTSFPRLLFESFLGLFGWMSVRLPTQFYAGYGAMWISALAGITYALFRGRWPWIYCGLILAPFLAFLTIVYFNLNFSQPQGRYLFPALNAISLVFVLGLDGLPTVLRRPLLVIAPLFLLLTNLYSLWVVYNIFPRA